MTPKEEYEVEKQALEIKRMRRKHALADYNEYIGFGVSRLSGLAAVVCGGLNVLVPSLIPRITHPQYLFGAGLALLTGKSIVSRLAKVLD